MRPLQHIPRLFRPRAGGGTPFATRPPPRQLPPQTGRRYSTQPNPNNPTPNPAAATTRVERIIARLPRPLQRYTARLRGAPLTHVAAFLVLHEITAVVPLLGLFGLFHYTEHVPVAYMLAHYGAYVRDGLARFERYFRRKGWFGFGGAEGEEEEEGGHGDGLGVTGRVERGREEGDGEKAVLERWEADPKYRVVVEVALAYALTKVLLPVRIVASVWATPWFAGVLLRLRSLVGRRG